MTNQEYEQIIQKAILTMYGRQDENGYTVYKNEMGFNAFDALLGKILAGKILNSQLLTRQEYAKADKMLRKYKGQLENSGIILPEMPDEYSHALGGIIDRTGDKFEISFEYTKQTVDNVKQFIKGVRYNGINRTWVAESNPESIKQIKEFASTLNFAITQNAQKLMEGIDKGEFKPVNEKIVDIRPNTFKGTTYTAVSIYFPYSERIKEAVKAIPSYFGEDDKGKKCWTINKLTQDNINSLRNVVTTYDFDVSENAKNFIKDWLSTNAKKEELKKENFAESSAVNANIEVEGLKEGMHLAPYQKGGIAYALKNKTCFIADEMGLGKTIQALATIKKANAYPALVVCTNTMKYGWEGEVAKWMPDISTYIIKSKDSPEDIKSHKEKIFIINYDILEKKKEALMKVPFESLVFDESQKVKRYTSKRTIAATDISKMPTLKYKLLLTGTPVLNRPEELISQLTILGRLNELGGFNYFADHYCDRQYNRFGADMSGAKNLPELNAKLREHCYVRRNKADVIKELPPIQRVIVPLDISNKREYEKVEKDLREWLKRKVADDQEFQNSLIGLSEEEKKRRISQRVETSTYRAMQAEQLTKIEATRQMSAEGKIEAFEEWVEDFIESGEKLVVFAKHKDVVNKLVSYFKDVKKIDTGKIDGDVDAKDRYALQQKFQTDPDFKLLIIQLDAGKEGLTLTKASNVAFLEQGWTPADHDQAEARCYGRINDPHAVTAWYFNGKNTIDDWIYELIENKRQVTSVATTGKGDTSNENTIFKKLTELLLNKKEKQPAKTEVEMVQPIAMSTPAHYTRQNKIKKDNNYHESLSVKSIA